MEEHGKWGWDLEEMRDAAEKGHRHEAMGSGFTPINPPGLKFDAKQPVNDNGNSATRSKGKAKAPTRRKTQSSATSNPQKVKKVKKDKTAEELHCQEVSKGLKQTKPHASSNVSSIRKTITPPELIHLKPSYDVQPFYDSRTSCENHQESLATKVSSRPPGLTHNYQNEFVHEGDHDNVPRPAPVRMGVRPETELLERYDHVDDFGQSSVSPPAQKEEHVDIDGALPMQKGLIPPQVASENTFRSDDIFDAGDELDDFPTNDEVLLDLIQSIAPEPAREEDLYLGWRPQDFTDDTVVCQNPEGHFLSDGTMQASSFPRSEADNFELPKGPCNEDSFDDDELDEDLAHWTVDSSDIIQPQTPLTSPEKPSSSPKLRWMSPKCYTPSKSTRLPTPSAVAPHVVPVNRDGDALPFTRPPFPKPIRDRSPILGLTNSMVLRTCFRIGEALNAAAVASRSSTDAIIELYARIILSERDTNGGFKQFFQFGDLFTDKPPYLSGTYSLWKGVGLWDVDSKPFVGEGGRGKMARVMGRIKRCEQGGGCEMVVLSIWEVDWEDVDVAKGIVCS